MTNIATNLLKSEKDYMKKKIKNSDYEPNWDEVFNNKILKPLNEK